MPPKSIRDHAVYAILALVEGLFYILAGKDGEVQRPTSREQLREQLTAPRGGRAFEHLVVSAGWEPRIAHVSASTLQLMLGEQPEHGFLSAFVAYPVFPVRPEAANLAANAYETGVALTLIGADDIPDSVRRQAYVRTKHDIMPRGTPIIVRHGEPAQASYCLAVYAGKELGSNPHRHLAYTLETIRGVFLPGSHVVSPSEIVVQEFAPERFVTLRSLRERHAAELRALFATQVDEANAVLAGREIPSLLSSK